MEWSAYNVIFVHIKGSNNILGGSISKLKKKDV